MVVSKRRVGPIAVVVVLVLVLLVIFSLGFNNKNLVVAISANNLTKVQKLLASGTDPNSPNRVGQLPLFEAISSEHSYEMTHLLLEHGADANIRNQSGSTPLLHALWQFPYDPQVISLLLDYGADVTLGDESSNTPLSVAALHLFIDPIPQVIRLLLEHGADPNAVKDRKPLLVSAIQSSTSNKNEIVELSLEFGADVNGRDYYGNTPLISSLAKVPDLELVELLLRFGADVTVRDGTGKTPLILVASKRDANHEIMEALIRAGSDVNLADESGRTAFQYAVMEGNVKVVEVLLDAGANANSRIDDEHVLSYVLRRQPQAEGLTMVLMKHGSFDRHALNAAIEAQDIDVARYLIEAGANVNPASDPPLALAIKQQFHEMIDILLHCGANIEPSGNEPSPLMVASEAGEIELVKTLISLGANVNRRIFPTGSKNGWTTLMYAVSASTTDTKKLETVDTLIKAGADVNARASNGSTVLMLAVANSKEPDVVALLLDAGADGRVRADWKIHGGMYSRKRTPPEDPVERALGYYIYKDITAFELAEALGKWSGTESYFRLRDTQY